MADDWRGILCDQQATAEQIRQAWEQAAAVAVENHRLARVPLAVSDWEKGQVMLIPVDDESIPGKLAPATPATRSAEEPEMIALMRQGVVEALADHKRAGRSVIVWDRETQQIVEVPPPEISIPEASD